MIYIDKRVHTVRHDEEYHTAMARILNLIRPKMVEKHNEDIRLVQWAATPYGNVGSQGTNYTVISTWQG